MYRNLVVLLLLGLLAAGAGAERLNIEVVDTDALHASIQHTFRHVWGDTVFVAYDDSLPMARTHVYPGIGTTFNPGSGAMPAWLNWQLPEKAGLKRIYFAFEEMSPAATVFDTVTYAWGDTIILYVGEEYRAGSVQCGLWRRGWLALQGEAAESTRVFLWAELLRD